MINTRCAMIKRIMGVLHGFKGHLFGDMVVSSIISDDFMSVDSICCSMHRNSITYIQDIINLDYNMSITMNDAHDQDMHFVISHKCVPNCQVNMVMTSFIGVDPIESKIKFDFDMLYMSLTSLYTRNTRIHLHHAFNRIHKKLFCIGNNVGNMPMLHCTAMMAAMKHVQNGWTMDDIVGLNSWILRKWEDVERMPFVRTANTANCQQCAICCEMFKKGDIVANMPCNHNFHSVCITAWLAKDKDSCPCCRTSMIEKSQHREFIN